MTKTSIAPVRLSVRVIGSRQGRRMLISLLAGSTLSLPLAVQAQTVTWDGTTNNDWGTDTNWSGDTVPNSTAVIDDGDLANQPGITSTQTVGQTDISDGTLTVAAALTSPEVNLTGDASLVLTNSGSLVGNIETAGTSSVANGGLVTGNVVHIGGCSPTPARWTACSTISACCNRLIYSTRG